MTRVLHGECISLGARSRGLLRTGYEVPTKNGLYPAPLFARRGPGMRLEAYSVFCMADLCASVPAAGAFAEKAPG